MDFLVVLLCWALVHLVHITPWHASAVFLLGEPNPDVLQKHMYSALTAYRHSVPGPVLQLVQIHPLWNAQSVDMRSSTPTVLPYQSAPTSPNDFANGDVFCILPNVIKIISLYFIFALLSRPWNKVRNQLPLLQNETEIRTSLWGRWPRPTNKF